MFGRGSPRINLMQGVSNQKKPSPKCAGNMQKKGPSPKVAGTQKKQKSSAKVDTRAHWNAGLEKALVDLLHEHDNDCYRGQNGWSSEAWNRIVKLFNEKFSHIKFSKVQIQDKEKELKRDYKILKEAKKQSGSHWNGNLGRIEADPSIWANIIDSIPKAKKFQTKCFPLFEALGGLYDGHTAEGNLCFTSIEPSQAVVTQANDIQEEETENGPSDPHVHAVEHDDDDDVRIIDQPSATSSVDKRPAATLRGKRVASARNKDPTERVGQRRRQDGMLVDMMGRYLERKEKQAETEDQFPISACITVVDEMEDLSDDEKVEAYDVFKDAQNRAIFMTAKDSTRLKWLRKKIRSQG